MNDRRPIVSREREAMLTPSASGPARHPAPPPVSRRQFIGGGAALIAAVAVPVIAQSQFFDVPFVPTPQVVVDEMLRLAAVGASDLVYDLGSGDGRIVITSARKFGAHSIVIELDEHLIYQSEESARHADLLTLVKFMQQDF